MKFDVEKLVLLNDNVLVEAVHPAERGGVAVAIGQDEKPEWGKVIAVGPGHWIDEHGERAPMTVKVGQIILFNQYSATSYKIGSRKLHMIREEDVVGHL